MAKVRGPKGQFISSKAQKAATAQTGLTGAALEKWLLNKENKKQAVDILYKPDLKTPQSLNFVSKKIAGARKVFVSNVEQPKERILFALKQFYAIVSGNSKTVHIAMSFRENGQGDLYFPNVYKMVSLLKQKLQTLSQSKRANNGK